MSRLRSLLLATATAAVVATSPALLMALPAHAATTSTTAPSGSNATLVPSSSTLPEPIVVDASKRYISEYQVTAELRRHGILAVGEHITVEYPKRASQTFTHTIPTRQAVDGDQDLRSSVSGLHVTVDGHPKARVMVDTTPDATEVTVHDPKGFTGTQRFHLTYQLHGLTTRTARGAALSFTPITVTAPWAVQRAGIAVSAIAPLTAAECTVSQGARCFQLVTDPVPTGDAATPPPAPTGATFAVTNLTAPMAVTISIAVGRGALRTLGTLEPQHVVADDVVISLPLLVVLAVVVLAAGAVLVLAARRRTQRPATSTAQPVEVPAGVSTEAAQDGHEDATEAEHSAKAAPEPTAGE